MPADTFILDNRVHRTIKLSTDHKEYPLAPNSPYKILLKVINGKDTLVVTKNGRNIAHLTCTNTYPPSKCPSLITNVTNGSCQYEMAINDDEFRVIELQQDLIDISAGIVMVVPSSVLSSLNRLPVISSKLYYNVMDIETLMDDGGFKVPPDMG